MFESLSWEVAVVVPACLGPGLVNVLRLAVGRRAAVLLERERRATLAAVLRSPGVLAAVRRAPGVLVVEGAGDGGVRLMCGTSTDSGAMR
ncbi:hypothetical protein [Actinomadura sp. 9N215]|uniref:hypothetical protein n=1 Tax=Actinomadura sp. 9N215 TaxID=3375150 RepID=UPI0037A88F5B